MTIRLENSSGFTKRFGQHRLVELRVVLYPVWLMNAPYDNLLVLVLQTVTLLSIRAEEVRLNIEQRSLQPHMEEVRSVGVLDHVIVRRVGNNNIDRSVPQRKSSSGCFSKPCSTYRPVLLDLLNCPNR